MVPDRVLLGIGLFVLWTACAPGRAIAADPTTTTAPIRNYYPFNRTNLSHYDPWALS